MRQFATLHGFLHPRQDLATNRVFHTIPTDNLVEAMMKERCACLIAPGALVDGSRLLGVFS